MNPSIFPYHHLASRRTGLGHRVGLCVLASVAFLAGCGEKKDKPVATQAAAKVNKDEITVHQVNYALQLQRGMKPEQAEAVSKQILERLIDQQLALQRADELKLDRDPRVVQTLEAARREVLSRAYMERVGESAAKPTLEDVQKYYDDKPALFKERRVYSIQELGIEAKPEQLPELKEKLASAKNINVFVEYLKTAGYKFSGNQAVRAAEQLPLTSLDSFAKMKDGQAAIVPAPGGAQVIVLVGSRSQPVTLEQAKPAIEQFLLNERKRKLMEDDGKALRAAAKIQYLGKFAESAASAPASAKQVSTPAPAASGASGLSEADISKGMGLKK